MWWRCVVRFDVQKMESFGVPRGPLWAQLKGGSAITYGGRTIEPREVLQSARRGRKLTVVFDSSDSNPIAPIAKESDVLVRANSFETEQSMC